MRLSVLSEIASLPNNEAVEILKQKKLRRESCCWSRILFSFFPFIAMFTEMEMRVIQPEESSLSDAEGKQKVTVFFEFI